MGEIFIEISERQLAGYDTACIAGIHHQSGARLYKTADGYVIVNPAFDPSKRPPCRGMIVDNKTRAVINDAYKRPDLRVYYPGQVGPLMLNLPAVQNESNEWFYYVAENQKDAFFAFDFKRAAPARGAI